MDALFLRGEWKCALQGGGEESVMHPGITKMLLWCAGNSDSMQLVYELIVNIIMSLYVSIQLILSQENAICTMILKLLPGLACKLYEP